MRRVSTRLTVLPLLLCVAPLLGVAACSSAGPQASEHPTTQEEQLLQAVDRAGFQRAKAVISEKYVLVEGDILLRRDALLRGDYEHKAGPALVSKGYEYSSIVSPDVVGNIRLAFENDDPNNSFPDNVSNLENHFIFAGAVLWPGYDWSQGIYDNAIRVSESNTGPTITVHVIAAEAWRDGPCPDGTACADPPAGGNPGSNIYVQNSMNPYDNPGQCEYSDSLMWVIALHEMGHTLGFAHPREMSKSGEILGWWIEGTQGCSDTPANCLNNAGYDTVMTNYSQVPYPDCSVSPSSLSYDDALSARTLYHTQY